MITSKKEYLHYLQEDKRALQIKHPSLSSRIKEFLFPHPIWKFQKTLRKLEYSTNCQKGLLAGVYRNYLKLKFRKVSIKMGFSIPPNVFGPGLAIVHYGTIVVNANSKVGKNCRIHACTNIGASGGKKAAPQIGDNVYIAPGAKIYGDITIGNNIAIGANAVVNKSFPEDGILIAGNPAQKIKEVNIKKIIKHIEN